jgi:hypothetical protein
MLKREDFVVGMVQTSLYQSAAAVDAPTHAEMETFAMAVVQNVLSNKQLLSHQVYKTDKSKRSHLAFWREQKLKLDRPSPKKPSFRDKSISFFFHNDKQDLEQLVLCLT